MATYFCSDPHASHANIMKYCRRTAFMTDADRAAFFECEARGGEALAGWRPSRASVEAMNEGLAANVNARVGADDTLWCLGDWCFGRGDDYLRNARRFRTMIACREVHLVWGNHDDPSIADLFASTHAQAEIEIDGARLTLNHYPMVTWNGQHHATTAAPNVHLYGHVHGAYRAGPEASPVRDPEAWAALDVGFDGHGYQVWSLDEVLNELRPRIEALNRLKRERCQFDPFRRRSDWTAPV